MNLVRDRGTLWVLLFSVLLSTIVVPAYAATTIGPQAWNRYSGTRSVAGPFSSLEDCANATVAGNYTCRVSIRVIVTDEPPECPSQPAPETQPGTCPTGTSGSWTQSRAYITAPYPSCWTAGPWVPAEPPAGACVEPPPPPPPEGGWTHCANQGEICEVTGSRVARFGVDTRWVEREFSAPFTCASTSFGGINPASGALKTCQIRAGTEPPTEPPPTEPPPTEPPGTGTVALRWEPPTTNTDDTPLTDLAGFRIHYGQSQDQMTRAVEVGPALTRYVIEGLPAGTWYFGMTAWSPGGESVMSSLVSTTIQ